MRPETWEKTCQVRLIWGILGWDRKERQERAYGGENEDLAAWCAWDLAAAVDCGRRGNRLRLLYGGLISLLGRSVLGVALRAELRRIIMGWGRLMRVGDIRMVLRLGGS